MHLHAINDLYITYEHPRYINRTQVIPNGLKWTLFPAVAPQMQSIGCITPAFYP